MVGLDLIYYFALVGVCLGLAVLALWLVGRPNRRDNVRSAPVDSVHFLLVGNDIVQTTELAQRVLIEAGSLHGRNWRHLYRAFNTRFRGLPKTAEAACALAPARIPAHAENDEAYLTLELVRGHLRLGLEDSVRATLADRHLRIHHGFSLDRFGSAAHLYPYPVWLTSNSGTLDWANAAYHALRPAGPAEPGETPLPELELQIQDGAMSRTERLMIADAGEGKPRWFNVTKTISSDGGSLNYASDIDKVIEAEIAQRKFVQTLTKTFAQLSTGLAIFDRERQLALFNPALIDLLALPADFLSSRPTLVTFFDRLRETRMMPEPKNYSNWRQQIAELVIASVDGRFQETWTLPSGLTYRVTGRPHPDGAIALLFEDISAEISLTRRFRAQLNLGQAVIDTLDEAIAVFSTTGILTNSNRAYRHLWKSDPDTSFAEVSMRDALRQWQSMACSSPFWVRLRDYMIDHGDRTEWFGDVPMKDGTTLECRVSPLTGGATLVGFRPYRALEANRPLVSEGSETG